MYGVIRRYGLTEAERESISRSLLLDAHRGRPRKDARRVRNDMISKIRSGAPRRDAPTRYSKWI